MIEFWNALTTKLRADSGVGGLVSLTGHAAGDMRIFAEETLVKIKVPSLVCCTQQGRPLESTVTEVSRTPVLFRCVGKTLVDAAKIHDRLKELLDQKGETAPKKYLDISDTVIWCKMTNYRWTVKPVFDSDTDSWTIGIRADFVWHKK